MSPSDYYWNYVHSSDNPEGTIGAAIGPELNSYLTYMFNPSFGLSLGGNVAYYFVDDFLTAGPSGGLRISVTFAR